MIGAMCGVAVGFLMGLFKPVSGFKRYRQRIRPVPTIALVPIVILLAVRILV